MKRVLSTLILIIFVLTIAAPIVYAEETTDASIVNKIVYADTFDNGVYTTQMSSDNTELYLYKDGVKTWTFAKNTGSFAEDDALSETLLSGFENGKMTTTAMNGTTEAYLNFPTVTYGTVTVDLTIDSIDSNSGIYFGITADEIKNVHGSISPSGDEVVGTRCGFNNNEGYLASMTKNHTTKYLIALNSYTGATSKKNYPSGNGATIATATTYDLRYVLDVDNQKQSIYYKKATDIAYKSLVENINWYANGYQNYTVSEKKVSGLIFSELTKAALNIDSISVTHSYEQSGAKPIALDAVILGTPLVDSHVTASYAFSYDGTHEGETTNIVWYTSDDREGTVNCKEVQNSSSKEYIVKEADIGKYITCIITPACMVEGAEVFGPEVKGINGYITRATATQPVGAISAPIAGDVYASSVAIKLSVDADSGESQITKVEYYIDDVKYSESMDGDFDSTYSNGALGAHSVYAVITNTLGETSTTAKVSFTIADDTNTFEQIGNIHKRSAKEIDCDWFSIGCECLDRDMAVFSNYDEYLYALGATKARIQGGWAKCEKEKGVYSWEWLDEVVYGMVENGITPWINTCYGNSIYEGGGGTTLDGGIPTSEEALTAWDNWVREMVTRYKDVVHEWEIWNEGDHNNSVSMTDYVTFFIRTSDIIKSVDPDAKVIGLAASNSQSSTLKNFMGKLKDRGRLDTIDHVTVHGYSTNPDDNNNKTWTDVIKNYSTEEHPITIWCGETGVPHKSGGAGALGGFNSSEMIQSKWLGRRLLDARSKNVVISYYTMIDLMYRTNADGSITQNIKGLIAINNDMTVKSIKQAYYTYQNLASVFDNSLNVIPDYDITATGSDRTIHMTGYEKTGTGKQVIATWFKDGTPTNSTTTTPITYTVENGDFDDPVYVDIRTGEVFKINNWSNNGTTYTFNNIPVYDSAILIAESSALQIDYLNDLSVSIPVVTNENGTDVNVKDDKEINVTAKVTGSVVNKTNLHMMIALYKDDILVQLAVGEELIVNGDNISEDISCSTDISDDGKNADRIKIFVWDNNQTEYIIADNEIKF